MVDVYSHDLYEDPNYIFILPVGSRFTSSKYGENSDWDYLCLVKEHEPDKLFNLGYKLDTSGHYEPSMGAFNSWRRGPINIIVTDSVSFYKKFQAAAMLAEVLDLTKKKQRVALFQAILYNSGEFKLGSA